MAKFNKLNFVFIKLIWFFLLINIVIHRNVQAEDERTNNRRNLVTALIVGNSKQMSNNKILEEDNNRLVTWPLVTMNANTNHVLRRVKRKGIRSFLGSRSKTPNTNNIWIREHGIYSQVPIYGPSGSKLNSDSVHFSNYTTYHEQNSIYLIVASISFGVIVYCCYQCQIPSRSNLNDHNAYRLQLTEQQQINSNNDSSNEDRRQQFGNLDAYSNRKPPTPTAPLPTPQILVQTSHPFNRLNNNSIDNITIDNVPIDIPSYPTYQQPPPSYSDLPTYEEATTEMNKKTRSS